MIWFILLLIVIIFACFFTYKTAEVHELHKMRAAFEIREHEIEKLISNNSKSDKTEFNLDYYNGEIEELEEMKKIINQKIEELKNFDILD